MTNSVQVMLGFIDGYSGLLNVRQRLGHRFDRDSAAIDAEGDGAVFMSHHSFDQ